MVAYPESYLHDAQLSLGEMLDYVVCDCGVDLEGACTCEYNVGKLPVVKLPS